MTEAKIGEIRVYNEIITYINYIAQLIIIENIKNNILNKLMYLLNHLKYNCNVLINILKTERLDVFFEITRYNIELLCMLKYFLINKNFVEERVLTYNFFKIK